MIVAAFVGVVAHALEPWSETDLTEATEEALEVLPWHQYVVRTALKADKAPNAIELSIAGAPGRFELPDGSEEAGSLQRWGMGLGFGFGRPRTGFSMFAGGMADYALVQGPQMFSSSGTLGMAANAMGYGGIAVKGWTLTAGALARQPLAFASGVGGSPVPLSVQTLYSLYNQEGVALGAIRGENGLGEQVFQSLAGQVRPEKLLEKSDLRRFGVFALGLTRVAEGLDIYHEATSDADSPAMYEVPLAADDIGESGFRVSVVPQVAPLPTVRRALAGYVHHSDKLVVGGQGGLLNRGGGIEPSVQVYAAFRPEWFKYFSIYGVPRIAVSYSYNVPDPVSFFPISHVHVVGIQYVYGREEFARPLLPIYRTTEELEKDPKEGGDDTGGEEVE